MAQLYVIPVKKQIAHQRLQVELSGKTYVIDLTWNGREEAWMLDFYDANLSPLILNKFLSNQTNAFLDNYWDSRIPRGLLGLFSEVPETEPTYSNLGNEIKLYYYEI